MSHHLRNQIHSYRTGDSAFLSGVSDEIVASGYGSDYEGGLHVRSHVWREYNRLCRSLGQENSMIIPYDAGFRPLSAPAAGILDGYTQPNGDFYLQPNGSDYYLQP